MKNFLTLILLLLSTSGVLAISFDDKDLDEGQVLNPIKLSEVWGRSEIHWDAILTSDWSDGFAGVRSIANEHRAFIDYRVEGHLPLYNLARQRGRLITRVQGTGFIDENINDFNGAGSGFFDDQLIDIPELFWQNDTRVANNDLRLVFGKFANRRFFNKDEINPDPFDIGEMRFSGAIANTLNLLSGINQFRDADLRFSGSIQASGSYGLNIGIKNQDKRGGLFKRWGIEQAFAVSQLDQFASNFYGITELNKDWGYSRPGRLETGFLYANDGVFRIPGNSKNNNLIYSSLVQRINDRLSVYLRYGSLFRSFSTNNEYRAGFFYKWTKKFVVHHWLGLFDGEAAQAENDKFMQWVNVFTYKLGSNFFAQFATVFRFNQFNPAASNLRDNNYTVALQLRYLGS